MSNIKLWNAKFVQLLLIETTLQFGMYTTRPIVSGYALTLGASVPFAGFLAGLLATAALAIRPLSGALSDRLDKKQLLVISCGLFSLSALGCSLFDSLTLLSVFLTLQGFAFAFKSTVVISLASLIVPQNRIGTGVGLLGLAYTIACATGPAAGSVIKGMFDYPAVFVTSFLLLLLGFFLAVFLRIPEGSQADNKRLAESSKSVVLVSEQEKFSLKQRAHKYFYFPAMILSLIAGLLMVAQGITSSFILVVGEFRGIDAASFYFVFYSLSTLAARPIAGRASDDLGVNAVVVPMLIVAALSMVAIAFIDSFAGIVIAGILMGAGQGSAYCSIQAESVRGVDKDKLGRAANTFYLGPDLFMGLGPVMGGFILEAWGITAMFLFCAGSILLALLLFCVIQSNSKSLK